MRVQNLGELTGDVLIFGGPYSNLQALQALIDVTQSRGITPDNCICTGDVVAYCADAAATTALIRGFGCAVVAGNCEKQLGLGATDCGCGFEDGTACDVLSAGWYGHANAQIDAEARGWMAELPDIVTFEYSGRRVAVIHGGVTDVARFIWPVSGGDVFTQEIAALSAQVGAVDMVVAGHSGLAFARDLGDVQWVNAGVIGMPPHDGRPETRFAVLGDGGVVFERLAYDHKAAIAAMQAAGLTQGYHSSLTSGIWPNEDVLPKALRRGG